MAQRENPFDALRRFRTQMSDFTQRLRVKKQMQDNQEQAEQQGIVRDARIAGLKTDATQQETTNTVATEHTQDTTYRTESSDDDPKLARKHRGKNIGGRDPQRKKKSIDHRPKVCLLTFTVVCLTPLISLLIL